jgi:Protein of unknown function (DUF4231)
MTDFKDLPTTEAEYLEMRVTDQITWFDKKSGINKRYFIRLKIAEIFLALFVPFLSAYISSKDDPIKVVVGIIGIVVAALASIITLVKFQENWVEYRTAAESLKFEKYLFLSKAGPYKELDKPFPFFVEQIESIISTSTKRWIENSSAKSNTTPTSKPEDTPTDVPPTE